MSKAPLVPELSPFDEVRFVEHHRPNLEAGDYDITVKQEINLEGKEYSFDKTAYVAVRGDRFELAPEAVHAVFPPAGSRGNYWHHFPHVILNRSTLPWERSACDDLEKDKQHFHVTESGIVVVDGKRTPMQLSTLSI